MKISKLLLPAIIVVGLAVYISCRRNPDRSFEQTIEQKFFMVPADTDPAVKMLMQNIYRQNQRHSFVNGLVNRIGFAKWNKAMISAPQNNSTGRSAGGSDTRFVYIPFVKNNQNFTNSVLIVKLTNGDTTYKLLYAEEYLNYSFDTTVTNTWNARNVFHVFTRFDNSIFGHIKFSIKDSRLFGIDTSLNPYVTFMDGEIEGCSNCSRSVVPVTICNTYKKCQGSNMRTTNFGVCANPVIVTVCTTYWIELGSGGGGGGGGEGGGGGGGGGDPWWEDPCVEMRSTMLPCDNQTGWTPVLDTVPPKPIPVDSILARYWRAIKHYADSVYNTMSNPNNWEYFFPFVEKDSLVYPKRPAVTNQDSIGVRPVFNLSSGEILRGYTHDHVSRSPDPTERRSFSPDDINYLRFRLNQDFVSFANCSDKIYALVILNPIKARAFFDTTNLLKIRDKYWTTGGGNMQQVDERCVRSVIDSSQNNGIGFYKSTNTPDFTIWIKLN